MNITSHDFHKPGKAENIQAVHVLRGVCALQYANPHLKWLTQTMVSMVTRQLIGVTAVCSVVQRKRDLREQ